MCGKRDEYDHMKERESNKCVDLRDDKCVKSTVGERGEDGRKRDR